MSARPLSHDELMEKAPTLFTSEPHYKVSDKYHFIPTIDVIDQIKQHNWHPMSVQEASVKDESKEGYQRHLVRFRHFDDLINPQSNAVELLLLNSHDCSTAFSISAGIYRFVCANGLVIANKVFESYRIKHIGERDNDVMTAINNITAFKPKLQSKIDSFEAIELTRPEQEAFARSAIPLRFEKHLKVDHKDLLTAHREADKASDLYTTLNVIQENLIRGNVSGINSDTGRRFTSREINSINRDVEVNQGLWDLAERIAMIKQPELALAA